MNLMPNILDDYYQALERLIEGKPIRVSSDSKICNDSVALEAGRNKSAIKKSRVIFTDLIIAIEQASEHQKQPCQEQQKIIKLTNELKALKKDLEQALGRELSLVYENYQLKKELKILKDGQNNNFNTLKN